MDVDVLKMDLGFLRTNPAGSAFREKYVHYKYNHFTHQNIWCFPLSRGSGTKDDELMGIQKLVGYYFEANCGWSV